MLKWSSVLSDVCLKLPGVAALNLDGPDSPATRLHYPCFSLWIPADTDKLNIWDILMGLSFPLEAREDHKRLIKLVEEAGT